MLAWKYGISLHMFNLICHEPREWVRYPVEHSLMYYSLFLLHCLLQHCSEITNFVICRAGTQYVDRPTQFFHGKYNMIKDGPQTFDFIAHESCL